MIAIANWTYGRKQSKRKGGDRATPFCFSLSTTKKRVTDVTFSRLRWMVTILEHVERDGCDVLALRCRKIVS